MEVGPNWGIESLGDWFEDYTMAHGLFFLHLPCLPALMGNNTWNLPANMESLATPFYYEILQILL